MNEVMNNYELLAPFQNKNAGFSRWTYAVREGKEYFLKEFLDPVYPTEESLSVDLRKQRIRECEEYELKKKHLYEEINNASDGNLIRVFEFFRYDSHYYISTEKVAEENVTLSEISELPLKDKLLLCKTIAHAMMKLHQVHIVHADIKESNIMIKRTETGKLIGKVIDFDCSFFEDNPPVYEDELGGDQVYLAPEACQFICGDSVKLTSKIDVFALGLLFHKYLTGEMPGFDVKEYDYAFDAVLDNQKLIISEELPAELQVMLEGMLKVNPEKRLQMDKVYEILYNLNAEEKKEEYLDKKSVKKEDWFYSAGDL